MPKVILISTESDTDSLMKPEPEEGSSQHELPTALDGPFCGPSRAKTPQNALDGPNRGPFKAFYGGQSTRGIRYS